MSLSELTAGYLRALAWRAVVTPNALRRDLLESDIDATSRTAVFNGLSAIWTAHGAAINAAPGIPGLRLGGALVGLARQAGRDILLARNGLEPIRVERWGAVLAAALTASVATLGTVSVEPTAGGIVVTVTGP